jgi:hypothetical protein
MAELSLEAMMTEETAAKGTPPPADPPLEASTDTTTTKTPETATAETPETPIAADDATTTTDAAPDESEVSIRDYAKDLLGDREWIGKYKDDDAFLKGIDELQKKLGERDESGRVVQQMIADGITPADLQRIKELKAKPGETASPEWDESWVTVDKKGNWIPTARAPADFEAKAEKYRASLNEAMTSPRKLAAFLKAELSGEIEASTQAARAEVQQRFTQEATARAATDWANGKAKLLYTKEVGGEFTPLGKAVDELLSDTDFYPSKPWSDRAERALKFATAASTPVPATKVVPNLARRQATPAQGTPKKMSDQEFFAKHPGANLGDFARWAEKGKMPGEKD